MDKIKKIGALGIGFAGAAARYIGFLLRSLQSAVMPPYYPMVLLKQAVEIGFYSLPVVALTALFAGMVTHKTRIT